MSGNKPASDGFPYADPSMPGNFACTGPPECADALESPGALADRLRPIVLGGLEHSCIHGTPMVPLHIATLTTIWNVLENAARRLGERG